MSPYCTSWIEILVAEGQDRDSACNDDDDDDDDNDDDNDDDGLTSPSQAADCLVARDMASSARGSRRSIWNISSEDGDTFYLAFFRFCRKV